MAVGPALTLALDLAARPGLARAMRRQPVPADVLTVIRAAASDADTLARAAAASGRDRERVRKAAVVYLQQVLLHPGADCYRVLGVRPDTGRGEAREHMRWLMKWLHPDRTRSDWDSTFASRVLAAWQEVSAAGRRAPRMHPTHRRFATVPAPRSGEGFRVDVATHPSEMGEAAPAEPARRARRRLVRAKPSIPWIAVAREGRARPPVRSRPRILRGAVFIGAAVLVLALVTLSLGGLPTATTLRLEGPRGEAPPVGGGPPEQR